MHDDHALMELVKSGDKESYNTLVKKYRVPAISFAYNILQDFQIAEDAVQEVFIQIYIKRASYRPLYQFKTFLYQAIRNKCIDYLRKSKRQGLVELDCLTDFAKTASAEEDFLHFINKQQIFSLIGDMKKDYKTAIYLFAVEGVSYEDIARIMHKTIPQVKIILYRARKKLKNQYGEGMLDER